MLLEAVIMRQAETLQLTMPEIMHRIANKVVEMDWLVASDSNLLGGFTPLDFPSLNPKEHKAVRALTYKCTDHCKKKNVSLLSLRHSSALSSATLSCSLMSAGEKRTTPSVMVLCYLHQMVYEVSGRLKPRLQQDNKLELQIFTMIF